MYEKQTHLEVHHESLDGWWAVPQVADVAENRQVVGLPTSGHQHECQGELLHDIVLSEEGVYRQELIEGTPDDTEGSVDKPSLGVAERLKMVVGRKDQMPGILHLHVTAVECSAYVVCVDLKH